MCIRHAGSTESEAGDCTAEKDLVSALLYFLC